MFNKGLSKIFRKDWHNQSRQMSINKEVVHLGKFFRDNLVTMLVSAFGFVAALNWNQTIQEAIKTFLPDSSAFYMKLWASIVVTIIAVFATYFLSKLKG